MKYLYMPESTTSTIFTVVGNPWPLLAIWLVFINTLAFSLMGVDKRRSKKEGKRRIPEKNFFITAILGGSIGAILGMRAFHHKTRHWYFVWGLPIILLLQIALIVWLAIALH